MWVLELVIGLLGSSLALRKAVHDRRVGLLELLKHLEPMLCLLQLARELMNSMEDHVPQGRVLDHAYDLLQH